ncbi:MAG TPA: hypothetical protein VHW67_10315 [Solirubrobacteraceae bacterium]|jgi:hypothetical protein|nr:hypothetical protein [Solirubrobacteraceae bacterium]
MLPPALVAYAMVLIWAAQTWAFVVLGLSALVWLQGAISLSLRIRREQRRERG